MGFFRLPSIRKGSIREKPRKRGLRKRGDSSSLRFSLIEICSIVGLSNTYGGLTTGAGKMEIS